MVGKLLIAGSINQDILVEAERQPLKGETLTGINVSYAPGGKGANQAVAAARLETQTEFIAGVGDDEFGKQLLANLAAEGVGVERVLTKSAPTGVAIVVVAQKDNSIIIVPGANAELLSSDLVNLELTSTDLVLAQCETPQAVSIELFKQAKSAGAKSILNPAPAGVLEEELIANTDYLIVNEVELTTMLDKPQVQVDLQDLVSPKDLVELANRYPLLAVICTLGAGGVLALEVDERNIGEPYRLASIEVDVIDTTGAGDCFVGAFASGLLQGKDFQDALNYANLAGSFAVQGLGAQTSMPTKKELAVT